MGLTNYTALGIEKEMNEVFNSEKKDDINLLIKSSYFENPSIQKRRSDGFYCSIIVTSCQSEMWWYRDLIGYTFFCRIRYRIQNDIFIISEFVGVKITKTKEILFRTFDPKDVIII